MGRRRQGLAHVDKHYLRTDLIERKKHALEAWDAQLKAIIANEPADNVVHLHHG